MSAAAASLLSGRRPFPGLRPFAYEDHDFFFGRQDQVFSLYRLIDRSRFVAVVGSSGSGKSSLVRAGLLPLLDREKTAARTPVWHRVEMRPMAPGDTPLENLAAALAGLAADDDEAIALVRRERVAFQLRYASIEQALAAAGGLGDGKLLLLVDQFEELFRFAGPRREPAEEAAAREEAVRFVQLLIDASRAAKQSITIVLTMRSDFIGECARFQGLPEVVSASQYLVPALTRDQREEVIRAPIKKAGATIDPILVERLLNDSGSDLDQLPVLQHCLLRTWQQAGKRATGVAPGAAPHADETRQLTEADYEAIGRMHRAMSQHADEIWNELPGKGREIERVFRALSDLSADNRAVRRPVPFATLSTETGASDGDLTSILDAFRDDDCSFLTPPLSSVKTIAPDTSIDLGHEALLRRWEKLTGVKEATGEANDPRPIGWLRRERGDARRYESLLSIAENDPHATATLSSSQTASYADWWDRLHPTPAWGVRHGLGYRAGFRDVEKLIERSQAHAAAEVRRAEENERREEDEERKRRLRKWVGAGSIAFMIVLVFAFFAGFYKYQAQERLQAETLRLQQETQLLALRSAKQFVAQINTSLTSGNTTVKGAKSLLKTTDGIVNSVKEKIISPQTKRLHIELILAEYDVYYIAGEMDESLKLAKSADQESSTLTQDGPLTRDDQFLFYNVAFRLGDMAARNGDKLGALAYYKHAHDLVAVLPENSAQQTDLLVAYNKIGEAQQTLQHWQDALQSLNAALAIAVSSIAKEPSNQEWQRQRGATLAKIGNLLSQQKVPDRPGAIAKFDEAIVIQKRLVEGDPTNDVSQSNLATSFIRKANVLTRDKKFYDAFLNYQLAIDIYHKLRNKDTDNAIWQDLLARYYGYYGAALAESGDIEAALDEYKSALDLRQRLIRTNPPSASYQRHLHLIESKIDELTARQTAEALAKAAQDKAAADKGAADKLDAEKAKADKAAQDKPAPDKSAAPKAAASPP